MADRNCRDDITKAIFLFEMIGFPNSGLYMVEIS